MNRKCAFIVLLAALVFSAGCVGQSSIKASLDAPFQIKLGQTAQIETEGLKIAFANITEDSRCPLEFRCFARGEAVIQVSVSKSNEELGTYELSDWRNSHRYNSTIYVNEYRINLDSVEPQQQGETPLRPSEYIATLTVSKK